MINRMKTTSMASAYTGTIVLIASLWSISAQAELIVSINMARDDGNENLTSGQTVGATVGTPAAQVGNWNNVLTSGSDTTYATRVGSTSGWIDSNGDDAPGGTGFSFFIAPEGGTIGNSADDAPTRLQRNGPRMQYDNLTEGDKAFRLNNTAALFGTNTFDLYVYGANPTSNDRTLTLQIDGTTTQQSLTMNRDDINTTWELGTDYLVFTGLTATTGTIQFDISGSGSATGFGGFQLVGEEIPEPASLALMGLGGLMMLGRSRRRA